MKITRIAVLLIAALLTPFVAVAKAVTVLGSIVFYHALQVSPFGAPLIALGANTLTNLIPDVYAALDVVSRELVGFIPAVARDSKADRLAIGQTLRAPQAPINTAGKDATAAMALPAAADQVIGNKSLTLSKARAFPFSWSGADQGAANAGPGFLTIRQDQIAQAIRAAVNEMETDVAIEARKNASRFYGTVGTVPFATKLTEASQTRKILDDNGAPQSDRQLIIDTTAGASLRELAQLTKVNEAGDSTLLRQGLLLDVHGFAIRESAQVQTPAVGTAAGSTTNNAGYAVGATTLTLAAAGTGTILAGDVITFAGDANKYVVATGNADVSAGGTIVLQAPGLRVAMSAATKAITMIATGPRMVGFSRNAIVLGTRLPDIPAEGDLAIMREIITDPRTNLSFELAVYPGYRMVHYEISIAWGVSAIKPAHIVGLLG